MNACTVNHPQAVQPLSLYANGREDGFDPIIEQDRKAQPFFNFGVSYSIFNPNRH